MLCPGALAAAPHWHTLAALLLAQPFRGRLPTAHWGKSSVSPILRMHRQLSISSGLSLYWSLLFLLGPHPQQQWPGSWAPEGAVSSQPCKDCLGCSYQAQSRAFPGTPHIQRLPEAWRGGSIKAWDKPEGVMSAPEVPLGLADAASSASPLHFPLLPLPPAEAESSGTPN